MLNSIDMKHPATQALYAYWNEVRRDRRAPRRLEIQPARIGSFLLDTFILERAERNVFRFRLAGTRVAARFGTDLRSRDFLSCWSEGDRSLLEHHLSEITDLGRVGLFTGELGSPLGQDLRATEAPLFELLVLPLVHTGQSIDRLLCLLVPLDEPASSSFRPSALSMRLLAGESIWPSAEHRDAFAYADRQLPLHPHVRMARIVRQGRRQFRVYEGGRDEAQETMAKRP